MGEGDSLFTALFVPFGSLPQLFLQDWGVLTLFHVGDFAAAPSFFKAVTLFGLCPPSLDSIKSDYQTRWKLAKLALVQNHHLLQDSIEVFKDDSLQHGPKGVWSSMHQLFSVAAVALEPLLLDALGSA